MAEEEAGRPGMAFPPARPSLEPRWRRRFRAPRISFPFWARDDPQRLVYTSNASGKWEVYTWDRQSDARRQVTDRPEGTPFGVPHPSGAEVWWFDDEKGNEFGRWVRTPFAGGEARPAAPSLPRSYTTGLALASAFSVLGSSGDDGVRVHLVRDGDDPRLLYAHREHANVVGLSRDEMLLCVSHSEHGDSIHPALRVLDLEGRCVGQVWDGPGFGLEFAGWSRVPGDQRALVIHERRDLPRPEIWDLGTGEVRELEVDLPGEVEASWYPDASAVLLTHHYRGRSQLYRLELASGALAWTDTEPGSIMAALARPDGEVWYLWESAATAPEVRADSRVVLHAPGETAPGGVRYSDHDVGGVHFFVAEPPSPRPHPAVFLVHGGPTWHDSDSYSPQVQAWVDHGCAVVLVNYRGSTGYGRAWRDALIGSPGFTELEDIAKVHDWSVREGIADAKRTVLSGRSWGGYLTLLGLGTQPERWSLGVAGVPVADYVAAYEDEMEPLKRYDDSLFGGTPEEKPDLYRERSPLTHIDGVRVPVFVFAGENDPRCPIRQIDNYLARLRALGKPHEVYRYDAGHASLVVDETLRQAEAGLDFAARHLGTTPPVRDE